MANRMPVSYEHTEQIRSYGRLAVEALLAGDVEAAQEWALYADAGRILRHEAHRTLCEMAGVA